MKNSLAIVPGVEELTETFLAPYLDEDTSGSHLTHIVNPTENPDLDGPGITARDIVFLARMRGLEVVALCGYRWIPMRNPEKYPVCQECFKIAEQLMSEAGE